MWLRELPGTLELRTLLPMTSDAVARASVISPAENWNRSNFYSVMSRSRRPSGISAANRNFETQ
jgi:hypothetical protein